MTHQAPIPEYLEAAGAALFYQTMEFVAQLPTVLGAIIGAMILWSMVILGGQALVRWLKLPTDLPDECCFEPPPPSVASAVGAHERAAIWRQRAEICGRAREVAHLEWQAAERIAAEDHPLRQQLHALTERAKTAMHDPDLEQARTQTTTIHDDATALWKTLESEHPAEPAGDNKRLLVLLVLLIVCVLWMVIGLPWLRDQIAGTP